VYMVTRTVVCTKFRYLFPSTERCIYIYIVPKSVDSGGLSFLGHFCLDIIHCQFLKLYNFRNYNISETGYVSVFR
jgi:hypothetical protein